MKVLSRLPLCAAAIAATFAVQVAVADAATFSPTGLGKQVGTLTISKGSGTTVTCNATFNGLIGTSGFFGTQFYPPAYYVETMCSGGYKWGFQMNEMAGGSPGAYTVTNIGGTVTLPPSPFGGAYAQYTWTIPFYNRTGPGPANAPRVVFNNTLVGAGPTGGLYVTGTLVMTTTAGADVTMT